MLEVLEQLVPNPLRTVNISAAALFRKVADGACTLLLDEVDTFLSPRSGQQHEELRGLVNAGHRRGAVAYRCVVEKGVKVEEFPAFAPAALAGIGDLPDTILDRSVVVAMKRRAPNEHVEPFRERSARELLNPIRDALEQWATRGVDDLDHYVPDMPDGLTDRPADVWEPLVAIGDVAGAPWCERVRSSATQINRLRQERDPSLGVRLLADCRAVFANGETTRLGSGDLLTALPAIDDGPWADLRGEPLSARGLARRLKPYGITLGKYRIGDRANVKGYDALTSTTRGRGISPARLPWRTSTRSTKSTGCGAVRRRR